MSSGCRIEFYGPRKSQVTPVTLKKRRAFTLIELICVIMILSSVVAISYPSMVASYHRQRLSSSAREISYELAGARSLSISRVDDRVYGVLFDKEGSYRTMAFKRGVRIEKEQLRDREISTYYGEKRYLNPGVIIKNFEQESDGAEFVIIFRADGVATGDAINFPLPNEISSIVLASGSVPGEISVKISKTTGINTLE